MPGKNCQFPISPGVQKLCRAGLQSAVVFQQPCQPQLPNSAYAAHAQASQLLGNSHKSSIQCCLKTKKVLFEIIHGKNWTKQHTDDSKQPQTIHWCLELRAGTPDQVISFCFERICASGSN